jgi:hypothetical protein
MNVRYVFRLSSLYGSDPMGEEITSYEEQLAAMRAVMEAVGKLDEKSRESVLSWVDSQFGRRKPIISSRPESEASSVPLDIGRRREGTISAVAQKLGAVSARELFLSAAAHLTLYQGKDSFTRDELIACAKNARGWKAEYSNRMATSITRMLDAGTLFEKSKNVFSLSAETLSELEGVLGS